MSDTSPSDDPYRLIGPFPTREIERVVERLESEEIDYQIEMDDTAIRRLDPLTAANGGTWGTGACVNLYIHQDDLEKGRSILTELYPELK